MTPQPQQHQGSRRVTDLHPAPFVLTERCPGPGCTKLRHGKLLACGRHWGHVPVPERQAVYARFSDYSNDPNPETLERLRAAQAAAVSCMREVAE